MSTMYLALLLILLLLAVMDLVVGVSNDAANFLNSAMGCKAAKRSVVLAVAALGVIIGASFSAGMMEIARSGVFVPAQFSFHDVMMIFLAVMLTDVILLDVFNSFGLPTSTTVSLVFELLGSALAVSPFRMNMGGEGVSQHLGDYINSSKALAIISGIFCSVAVAFSCGCAVMWLARLLFSFRYSRAYRYIGPAWCALALTSICYFAVFKGLKHSTLLSKESMAMLLDNLALCLSCCFGFCFVLASVLQYLLHVNTLKLTVLAGTLALALAFAGNDLVNFIGVFMAAQSSYEIASNFAAQGGDLSTLRMAALAEPVHANMLYLLGAGFIMVAALFFSKKARTVTETEIKLARGKSSGKERFGSCLPARVAVRYTLNGVRFLQRITPAPVADFIGRRFAPLSPEEESDAAFDLIRGSVNLTVAALLISLATSLKLPLSTTYVTFMVGMGSSLADRAWGRDSAVYRITGVLTVVGGWFMTGFAACTAAFLTASVLSYGGLWGIGLMLAVCAALLVKSALLQRTKKARGEEALDLNDLATLQKLGKASADNLEKTVGIYRATVKALLAEDRESLKRLRKSARQLSREAKNAKEDRVLPTLQGLAPDLAERGQLLFRLNESAIGIAESLLAVVKSSYRHIDNNHCGLNEEQASDLLRMTEKLTDFFPNLCSVLQSGNYANLEQMMRQAGDLSEEFADCITRHLLRGTEDETGVRTGILYLNLLNETRSLLRRSFSLIKTQRELFEA